MNEATGLGLLDLAILTACASEDAMARRPYRKTARILQRVHDDFGVGSTVAHDPLLDLGRPWLVQLELLDHQGNIGSPDDPAANPRYTETRLTALGAAALAAEHGEIGPLPIGLINGSMYSGGTHPPFSPRRVIDAIRAAATGSSDDEIVELVGFPTFPTGPLVEVDHAALAAGELVPLHQRAHVVHVGDELLVSGLPLGVGADHVAHRFRAHLDRLTRVEQAAIPARGIEPAAASAEDNHGLIFHLAPDRDPDPLIDVLMAIWELNNVAHVQLAEPLAATIRRVAETGADLTFRLELLDAAIGG